MMWLQELARRNTKLPVPCLFNVKFHIGSVLCESAFESFHYFRHRFSVWKISIFNAISKVIMSSLATLPAITASYTRDEQVAIFTANGKSLLGVLVSAF